MNVLCTGAAGYIGSVLCPALLAAGHRVTALDSFLYGPQQASALAACCADPNFTLVRGDARDHDALRPLVRDADAVIPLAAIVGAPACARDPRAARSTNLDAIATLATLLSRDQLVVYPNTSSGYGAGNAEACDEDSPFRPLSQYARDKAAAEALLLERPRNAVALRLATAYGAAPRMRTDLLVNDLTLRAARDRAIVLYEAHHRRALVHVADVAAAFVFTLKHVHKGGTPSAAYNVVGQNVTKRELADLIAAVVRIDGADAVAIFEADPTAPDPDQRDYAVSGGRLAAAGFTPRRALVAGIAELLKLYRGLPTTPLGNV